MAWSKAYDNIRNFAKTIDWKLLIFLLLFLHVKLVVKMIALVFIYIVRPDFKFGFRITKSRLPLFYILSIGIAVFNCVISGAFTNVNYMFVLLTGIAFWMACILANHQVKLAVEKNDPEIIHKTIFIFFIMNALFSFGVYAGIALETGTINPFRYQGDFQKYFMGTGDYIKGITFDTSTTNAVLNAFGVLYFLDKKNTGMTMLCMVTLLLTASNITNILLCCIFIWLFIFASNNNQKSTIVVCVMLGLVFMIKISPQNNKYIVEAYNNFFNRLPHNNSIAVMVNVEAMPNEEKTSIEEKRKQKIAREYIDSMDKIIMRRRLQNAVANTRADRLLMQTEKIVIPPPPVHSPSFQYKNDTSILQRKLLNFIAQNSFALPLANRLQPPHQLPGKIIGLQQTLRYFQQYPQKMITGTGAGNFSSKLAFRATAMKIAGGYPEKFAYINPDFESNHLDLYLSYFTRQDKLHSLTNSPNSVYDELLAEYGLAGMVAFFVFYLGFFAKHANRLTHGIPIMLFTAAIFFVDYWFEQLSVVILFELLLLLNIKEGGIQKM